MSAKPAIEANAIYTREEAAQVLGVSLSTLKHLIRAGHLVVSQPAGLRRVFIKGSSILDMLDRTTREPQMQAGELPASDRLLVQDQLKTTDPAQVESDHTNSYAPASAGRSKRAIKLSPTLAQHASGKKLVKAHGGTTG